MKRLIILTALLALFTPAQALAQDILATYLPVWSIANEVATGDREIGLLVPAGSDVHHYSLRPGDMRSLTSAELVIKNGAGLEAHIEPALKLAHATLDASKGLTLISTGQDQVNPHVWLDPMMAAAQTATIAQALSTINPASAAHYNKNADKMIARLRELDAYAKNKLSPFKGAPLVTYHDAFAYFARRYELKPYFFTGAHSEAPLPGRMRQLYDMARRHNIKAVFAETESPETALLNMADSLDLKLCRLDTLTAHTGGFGYYIKGMKNNIDTIARCLGGSTSLMGVNYE